MSLRTKNPSGKVVENLEVVANQRPVSTQDKDSTFKKVQNDIQSVKKLLDDLSNSVTSVQEYCDSRITEAIKTVTDKVDTVHKDLQQAKSDTEALLEKATAPLINKLSNLEDRIERSERQQKQLNIILKGLKLDSDMPRSEVTQTVLSLLQQHASDPDFTMVTAIPFGSQTNGPKPIRLIFPSATDKHAAFTASKSLRAKKITLDDDVTHTQLQQRKSLKSKLTELKERNLRPYWRGGELRCEVEQGTITTFTAAAPTPNFAAPHRYPRNPTSRVRRTNPHTHPTLALAAAAAAASAALAPKSADPSTNIPDATVTADIPAAAQADSASVSSMQADPNVAAPRPPSDPPPTTPPSPHSQ